MRRWFIGIAVLLAVMWLGINAYGGWYIAYRTAYHGVVEPGADVVENDPARAAQLRVLLTALDPEDVRVAPDLLGWFKSGEPGRPGWLLIHGAGGNRTSSIALAHALNQRGHPVLALGLSYTTGRPFGGGSREAEEIALALQWLEAKTGGPRPLLYGCSTGAYNAAVAVALGASPAGLVVDSGFVSFPRTSSEHSGIPQVVFAPMPVLYPLITGHRLIDVEHAAADRELSIPILVVHGTGDSSIDAGNGEALARAMGGELWAPDGVEHCAAFAERPDEFIERMDAVAVAAVRRSRPRRSSRNPAPTPSRDTRPRRRR